MRIALVSEHVNPLDDTCSRQHLHLRELAAGLARLDGVEVTVHSRRYDLAAPDEVTSADGYQVVHLAPAQPRPADDATPQLGPFAVGLAARWRRQRPDVVHAHHWTSGLAALLASRDMTVPVVQTFHGLGPAGVETPRVLAERLVGRRVDHVLATSSDEVDQLVAHRVPRATITLVPYGVDAELFTPDQPDASTRARHHQLLAVGPPTAERGMDDLVAAVARVPAAELVIVGAAEHPEAERLRALARRLGADGRLRLTCHLPRAELATMIRRADLVVSTPWADASGLVALEAMACATAVVATDVGGLADAVVHGVTGEHVPARRPDKLTATLARLVADPVSLEKYGTAGRDRALSRYQWDRVVADTERVYRAVVGAFV